MRAEWSPELEHKLEELTIQSRIVWEPGAGDDARERVAAVKRWFDNDWQKLDNKIKSSIVEGVSVFLSMFDMPGVAAVFCPPPPEVSDDPRRIGPKARAAMLAAKAQGQGEDSAEKKAQESRQWPGDTIAGRPRYLPPLYELIESGKVLALNMPAGSNPALARAIGVMLKNAWLQALLMRPAQMKESPSTYFRPAVFICDEYQSFASVGEDDPTGDEKSFALTRQCRCIPIVATQSISSLRAVLGSSEAWRALLQTLRTRIFLSLSDDASAKIASELCGQVAKIKGSYTISETSKRAGVSPLSGRAGGSGGSIGATKSFQERREAVFHPRDFALLGNCQAICLPRAGRWWRREHRRNQVFPGAPGGRFSAAREILVGAQQPPCFSEGLSGHRALRAQPCQPADGAPGNRWNRRGRSHPPPPCRGRSRSRSLCQGDSQQEEPYRERRARSKIVPLHLDHRLAWKLKEAVDRYEQLAL